MNCKFFLDKMGKMSKNVTVFLLRGKVGQSSKVSDEFLIQRPYNLHDSTKNRSEYDAVP